MVSPVNLPDKSSELAEHRKFWKVDINIFGSGSTSAGCNSAWSRNAGTVGVWIGGYIGCNLLATGGDARLSIDPSGDAGVIS